MVKNLPAIKETQVQSLGQEDPLEVPFSELTVRAAVMCWLDGCNILCLLTWQAIFYLSTHRTVNELRSLSVLMEDNFLESLVYSCYLVPWVEC